MRIGRIGTIQLVIKNVLTGKHFPGNFKKYYLLDFADIYHYGKNTKQLNNKINQRNQICHICHVNAWKAAPHPMRVQLLQNLSLKNLKNQEFRYT